MKFPFAPGNTGILHTAAATLFACMVVCLLLGLPFSSFSDLDHSSAKQKLQESSNAAQDGAGRDPGEGPGLRAQAPKLELLRLVPEKIRLEGARSSHKLIVLGKFSDGVERDLTSSSVLSVS